MPAVFNYLVLAARENWRIFSVGLGVPQFFNLLVPLIV